MEKFFISAGIFTLISLSSCMNSPSSSNQDKSGQQPAENTNFTTVEVEILNDKAKDILDENIKGTVIADNFIWSEGPLWIDDKELLLFSDVPANVIYQWTPEDGLSEYLKPAGMTTPHEHDKEPGPNGLILNHQGELVICQHGDHALSIMNAPIEAPQVKFKVLANEYQGKRLNSPNDVIIDKKGQYYFTDPDYGLAKAEDKELPFNGVFKIDNSGILELLIDTISHPNGLAFSPDEQNLYIANSNHDSPIIYKYRLDHNGDILDGGVFFDFKPLLDRGPGGPDGFKVDSSGNIYTSGPGGVWIISPEGEPLARLITENRVSNCALSKDEKTLFVTNTDKVLQIKLKN